MKHQSILCNDPVYELWEKCVDKLNGVPLVNDITNVIQKDNENESQNTNFNVISIIDLPVITDLEDPTYVESIKNIASLQNVSHDETDFMSYACTDDYNNSFDDGRVSDPADNIADCDNLDNSLKETETENSNLRTYETSGNDRVNNEEELRAEINSCTAHDLNDDNNSISDNETKSFEESSLTIATSTPSKGDGSANNNYSNNNYNFNNDKQTSDVSSQMIVKDLCDNMNKDKSKQIFNENESINMIKPLTENNSCQTNKTMKEIWDQHLSWPEVGEKNKNKKKEKEKLPFAITAPKWREYHQKLREEKEKKTLEAEEKALKRKIKKEEDEIKKQENKKIREMKKIERERKKEEKLKEKEEKAERKRKLEEENLKAKENKPVKKKKKST